MTKLISCFAIFLILAIFLSSKPIYALDEMPEWILTVIEYWSHGDIDDIEFFNAMSFLVNHNLVSESFFKNQLIKNTNHSDDPYTFKTARNYAIFINHLPDGMELDDSVINDALAFWKQSKINFIQTSDPEVANVKIYFMTEMAGPNDGYVTADGKIEIGLGTTVNGVWHKYDNKPLSFLLKHELGHFLGCAHNNDPTNVMNPKYNSAASYVYPLTC